MMFFHIQCCSDKNTLIRCVSFPERYMYYSSCYLAWPSMGLSLYIDPDLAAGVAKKFMVHARLMYTQCRYTLSY